MRFSVLGPLAAEGDDGSRLVLGRPSQRSTLAVLLLHAGQLPTRTLLIDALWGEHPPAEADTALRVRMRDLRRALACDDRLLTHPSGYRIMVLSRASSTPTASPAWQRMAGPRSTPAVPRTRPGCSSRPASLWRDPPLVDLPDSPLMRLAATLLEQRRDVREWLMRRAAGAGPAA